MKLYCIDLSGGLYCLSMTMHLVSSYSPDDCEMRAGLNAWTLRLQLDKPTH